jgi:hypothetical protein
VTGGEAVAESGPPPVQEGGEEEGEDEEEGEEIDDNNPLAALERERYREHEGSKGTWFGSVGIGSGMGYATGHSTEAFGKYGFGFSPGVAPATWGQLVPEIGYFVSRNTAFALTGRLQGIFDGPKGTATGALSGLLRVLFFTEDGGKVRWYFALAAGGGEGFRLRVKVNVIPDDPNIKSWSVKDTVRGGPFLAGVGGGMQYKLGRHLRWIVETQVLVGIPDSSGVVDLSTGARWLF